MKDKSTIIEGKKREQSLLRMLTAEGREIDWELIFALHGSHDSHGSLARSLSRPSQKCSQRFWKSCLRRLMCSFLKCITYASRTCFFSRRGPCSSRDEFHLITNAGRFNTSRFDTHLSRFVTKMKSVRYNPSRFDTNSCVCIKLKQKPQVQNQRFHNRIVYPQPEVCVMKWQTFVCEIAKSNLHNMNQSCLLRLSSCFDHHFLLQKCFDRPSFLDCASWRVTSVQ